MFIAETYKQRKILCALISSFSMGISVLEVLPTEISVARRITRFCPDLPSGNRIIIISTRNIPRTHYAMAWIKAETIYIYCFNVIFVKSTDLFRKICSGIKIHPRIWATSLPRPDTSSLIDPITNQPAPFPPLERDRTNQIICFVVYLFCFRTSGVNILTFNDDFPILIVKLKFTNKIHLVFW